MTVMAKTLYLAADLGASKIVLIGPGGIMALIPSRIGLAKKGALGLKEGTWLVGEDLKKMEHSHGEGIRIFHPLLILKRVAERQYRPRPLEIQAVQRLLAHGLQKLQKEFDLEIPKKILVTIPAPPEEIRRSGETFWYKEKYVSEIFRGLSKIDPAYNFENVIKIVEPFAVAWQLKKYGGCILIDLGKSTIDVVAMKGAPPSSEDMKGDNQLGMEDYIHFLRQQMDTRGLALSEEALRDAYENNNPAFIFSFTPPAGFTSFSEEEKIESLKGCFKIEASHLSKQKSDSEAFSIERQSNGTYLLKTGGDPSTFFCLEEKATDDGLKIFISPAVFRKTILRGRSVMIDISKELRDSLEFFLSKFSKNVIEVLETLLESVSTEKFDIIKESIILVGEGSKLAGLAPALKRVLDDHFGKETGYIVSIGDVDSATCAKGAFEIGSTITEAQWEKFRL